MKINPYLHFNGQCEAAFKFYAQSLGGKIIRMVPYEGTPTAEHLPAEWRSKIVHARLEVGDQVLLGCDPAPAYFHAPQQGFSVSLNVTDPAEGDRIFHALGEKGTVQMAIAETFWAIRFGMLVDQFGIPWTVNCYEQA